MKKILLFITIIVTNFSFGQITLEKNYANEEVQSYTNASETFYYTVCWNSPAIPIKIYNSDHTIKKQFTPTIPAGYNSMTIRSYTDCNFLSKNIFNADDLLEIVVAFGGNNSSYRIVIYNEDGAIVKDFGDSYQFTDEFDFYVYHDNTNNKNKLRLYNTSTNSTEIYNLNSSSLALKEINTKNKLSAYPIPTNNILNISNPENGANKIEVYDTSGKMIITKSFENYENTISLDVENLTEGIYIYKIGNLSSKFTKN